MRNDTYKTSLYSAACIYMYGIKLINVERDGYSYIYTFENKKLCEVIVSKFNEQSLNGNITDFVSAILDLEIEVMERNI